MTNKRILICGGNPQRTRSLAYAISGISPQWLVSAVNRGEDGINILKDSTQDCILIEEKGLPDRDGIHLLKEIREIDREVPVILLSRKPDLEISLEAIHIGILDILKEPYTVRDLQDMILLAFEKKEHPLRKESPPLEEKRQEEEEALMIPEPFEGEDEDSSDTSHGLLSRCLSLSMSLLKADQGAALLVERKRNRLVVSESIGFNGNFEKNSSLDVQRLKSLEKIVAKGKPDFMPWEDGRLACAPIGTPPNVFGVILLGRCDSFEDSDLKVLSVFAPLAPYALEVSRLQTELEAVRAGSSLSLLVLLEAKDPGLRQHSLRVMKYSVALAKSIEVSDSIVRSIKFSALLHDVGKIVEVKSGGVEIRILTDRIVEPLRFQDEVKHILHHQRERFDGLGEPDSLQGEEIPLGSRILSIAEAYDEAAAEGKSQEEAVSYLKSQAGILFDPNLVDHFLLQISRLPL